MNPQTQKSPMHPMSVPQQVCKLELAAQLVAQLVDQLVSLPTMISECTVIYALTIEIAILR